MENLVLWIMVQIFFLAIVHQDITNQIIAGKYREEKPKEFSLIVTGIFAIVFPLAFFCKPPDKEAIEKRLKK